jgi:hypothetical protein
MWQEIEITGTIAGLCQNAKNAQQELCLMDRGHGDIRTSNSKGTEDQRQHKRMLAPMDRAAICLENSLKREVGGRSPSRPPLMSLSWAGEGSKAPDGHRARSCTSRDRGRPSNPPASLLDPDSVERRVLGSPSSSCCVRS